MFRKMSAYSPSGWYKVKYMFISGVIRLLTSAKPPGPGGYLATHDMVAGIWHDAFAIPSPPWRHNYGTGMLAQRRVSRPLRGAMRFGNSAYSRRARG